MSGIWGRLAFAKLCFLLVCGMRLSFFQRALSIQPSNLGGFWRKLAHESTRCFLEAGHLLPASQCAGAAH